MSIEENIAIGRRLIQEGFSDGNLAVCDELVAIDGIEHQRGLRPGAAGTKETIQTLHEWFSDFRLEVEDVSASGDMVWLRARATGVNSGSVFGRSPTGRPFEITVFDQVRIEDGRIVEHWGVPDQLGMLLQLGLFGRPEPVGAGAAPGAAG
ncbi:MAG: ester cyclase [Candidatus Limnocylindrales bacterium]